MTEVPGFTEPFTAQELEQLSWNKARDAARAICLCGHTMNRHERGRCWAARDGCGCTEPRPAALVPDARKFMFGPYTTVNPGINHPFELGMRATYSKGKGDQVVWLVDRVCEVDGCGAEANYVSYEPPTRMSRSELRCGKHRQQYRP